MGREAESVLIVGASIAGMGVATELREAGFAGPVTLADAQPHLPYDRPPLSKSFLVDDLALPETIALEPRESLEANGIALALGRRAAELDAGARSVRFDDGTVLQADRIVIATGARARAFPADRCRGHIWCIRNLDDALGLRTAIRGRASIAVIGGGFIGAEVASSARARGLEVDIFEALQMPFQRIVGPDVAGRLLDLHIAAGVRMHCGLGVDSVDVDAGGASIRLQDGQAFGSDLVVAGLGAIPNLEWLGTSGLVIDDGIICDDFGRTSAPYIHACGDVSVWRDPVTGFGQRYEHWTSAKEQARIVARHIAGVPGETWAEHVPYFWSDIHSRRFQVLGSPAPGDEIRLAFESPEKGAFVAEYWRGGRLAAVAGLAAAARTMRYLGQLKSQLQPA